MKRIICSDRETRDLSEGPPRAPPPALVTATCAGATGPPLACDALTLNSLAVFLSAPLSTNNKFHYSRTEKKAKTYDTFLELNVRRHALPYRFAFCAVTPAGRNVPSRRADGKGRPSSAIAVERSSGGRGGGRGAWRWPFS